MPGPVKPAYPSVQPGHPLAEELRFFAAPWESHAPSTRDQAGGLRLAATGGAYIDSGGVLCNATGKGFQVTLPAHLKLAFPITVACRLRVLGTPGASAPFFSLAHNNADTTPWASVQLLNSAGGFYALSWNTGGSPVGASLTSAVAPAVGRAATLVGILTTFGRFLFVDGVKVAEQASIHAGPTYGATALLALGNYTGINRNPNVVVEGAGLWSRAFGDGDILDLGADFFGVARPPADRSYLATVPDPVFLPRPRRTSAVLGSGVF